MYKTATVLLAAVMVFALAPAAQAATWNGDGGDNDVLTADNWDTDAVPDDDETAIINNTTTPTMSSDWPTSDNGNNGYNTSPSMKLEVGTGGNATFTQTGGNLDLYKQALLVGNSSNVGHVDMQGGSMLSGADTGGFMPNLVIGSTGTASTFTQGSGAGDVEFKQVTLADADDTKAQYTHNSSGYLNFGQYGMSIAAGGDNKEGIFTQTAGSVVVGDWKDNSLDMGNASGTNKAVYNLDGGQLKIAVVRGTDTSLGFNFNSTNETYVDIDGGELVLANNLGVSDEDAGPWDFTRFDGAYNLDNFRAFGEEITSASQLQFTQTSVSGPGITTGDGNGPYDATAITAVPEPATLALIGIGGIGVLLRRRRA